MKNIVELSAGASETVTLITPRNGTGSASLKSIYIVGGAGVTIEESPDAGTTWVTSVDVNGTSLTGLGAGRYNIEVVSTGLVNDGSTQAPVILRFSGGAGGTGIVYQDR